jgi:GH24 family phage-related lysozyme (muramidase)
MRPSEKGYASVAAREACVLTTYPDSHSPAIGFGRNNPSLKPGDTSTLEVEIAWLVKEGERIGAGLAKVFDGFELAQTTIDCLFSTVYNIGSGSLIRGNTELVTAIKAHAVKPAKQERETAGHWIVQAHPLGVEPPFNLARRCREALVFLAGDYGDLSTMKLWPAGTSPKNTPPDPPQIVPMPTFLKG